MKAAPLLTVLLLTAVAMAAQMASPAKELRSLGILLDLVPVAGVVGVTVIATVRLRSVSAPLPRLMTAAFGYFAGALVGTLGLAHLVAVTIAAIHRARERPFVYSFHFYSLILLGALLVAAGLIATAQVARLQQGHRAAWRASLLVWTTILALNLPLVPLQGFAVLFSALAALELLFLGSARRHFDAT